MTIRAAAYDDIPALKSVIEANDLFPSELLDGMMEGYLSGNAPEEFWLVLDEGGPFALAYIIPERMTVGTWNLLLIAVHPDHHGQGMGTSLLRHVEDMLEGRGERILLVETSGLPSFERTRTFYTQLGYEEEARIRGFYQPGEDKVIFRKTLSGR